MDEDSENPFRSTIWSFIGFGAAAACLYALDLKWIAYLAVILGSLITVALTASTIEQGSAPITGRFSPATGKVFAVVGFVCKLGSMVIAASALIYGIHWAWTNGSLCAMLGSLCY